MRNKVILLTYLISIFLATPVVVQETEGSAAITNKRSSDVKSIEERVAALEGNRWSDKIAIHGVLAGAYQYEDADGPEDAESFGRGAVAVQPKIFITPTEQDEIVFELAFPVGEGVNGSTQMLIPPWAANLEGDVKNIKRICLIGDELKNYETAPRQLPHLNIFR